MPTRLALAALALALGSQPASARAQRVIEIEVVPTARAQIAMWITDADGEYLATLALTEAVARRGIGNRPGASQMNGGFHWPYGRREGVLPIWAHARAAAPGAELFPRVIFQDRISEGFASRTSNDSSRDDYFCLSFNADTTGRDALDAVTCASVFMSDKGRYATLEDLERGYSEPQADDEGRLVRMPLALGSYYPPRRDVSGCPSGIACVDHDDVRSFAADVRRIFPEIDAITQATPPADVPTSVMFTLPDGWPDGRYRVLVEVNTEGDYNDTWNDETYPTPRNPPLTDPEHAELWDYWAMSYGYPYRGQPSVLYAIEIEIDAVTGETSAGAATPIGYGSLSGQGPDGGAIFPMTDGRITDDPVGAPGSGADRLRRAADGTRVRATAIACTENAPPEAPTALSLSPYAERRLAHRYAHLAFDAASDDHGVARYEVRVGTAPITDEASFLAAVPAHAATLADEALRVPADVPAGARVEVDFGGLVFETHYWVGVRAIDRCNAASEIVVGEIVTLPIEFTTVSPCFVATAAYGTPLADEIGVLRRFRDRHLASNALGALLVAGYEAIGPTLADLVRDDPDRRAAVRALLSPIVSLLGDL